MFNHTFLFPELAILTLILQARSHEWDAADHLQVGDYEIAKWHAREAQILRFRAREIMRPETVTVHAGPFQGR
jgi:hypothetical protein